MPCQIVCFVFILTFFTNVVRVRAYYIKSPVYLMPEQNSEDFEQSSRDLDLSFSAGADRRNNEPRNFIKPYVKKVYTYQNVDKPLREFEEGIDRPSGYYKIIEIPPKRAEWVEAFAVPERNRKLVKLNNGHKGEVILELRVTANNDNDNNDDVV